MPALTPEAWAQIRYDYEHTDRPVADICAEHGISSGTLRDRMRRWNWRRRRTPIPREGPPACLVVDGTIAPSGTAVIVAQPSAPAPTGARAHCGGACLSRRRGQDRSRPRSADADLARAERAAGRAAKTPVIATPCQPVLLMVSNLQYRSSPRKRGPSSLAKRWVPAFAGTNGVCCHF